MKSDHLAREALQTRAFVPLAGRERLPQGGCLLPSRNASSRTQPYAMGSRLQLNIPRSRTPLLLADLTQIGADADASLQ